MGRRRTPTFTAVEDILISSGLQQDRHLMKKLLWESASNVIFFDGTVRRKRAPALAYDIGVVSRIAGLGQLENSDGGRWLWGAAGNRISRWEFGAPEVIDDAFGSYVDDQTATQRPTIYDFTPYGNWMLINSGNDGQAAKIFKDPGLTTFAAGEAPVGVTRFIKILSFLMALGYGTRGTQIGWSDANNIELWTAATDNSAGSLSVDDFNTPIRAGARLGQSVTVYSEDQLKLINFIGAPFYFGQGQMLDGIGAIGKAAVASDLKVNVGVGRAGCWWTDTNSARYIDEGYLANYLQENVNWEQGAKIVVGRNDYTGTFEFHFPMRGDTDINEAWAWDPKTGGWSPVPFASMMDERRLFGYPVQGTVNGYVNWSDYDLAANTPLSLATKPLVMQTEQSPHTTIRVDEVDLLLHEASGLEFRVGCCDEVDGAWEYSPWMEATVGAHVYEIPELPEQPFWKLELRSVPGVNDWTLDLQGFLLYGILTGAKM
jgi:hypothetical protein